MGFFKQKLKFWRIEEVYKNIEKQGFLEAIFLFPKNFSDSKNLNMNLAGGTPNRTFQNTEKIPCKKKCKKMRKFRTKPPPNRFMS